jgi:hypothetical protein
MVAGVVIVAMAVIVTFPLVVGMILLVPGLIMRVMVVVLPGIALLLILGHGVAFRWVILWRESDGIQAGCRCNRSERQRRL